MQSLKSLGSEWASDGEQWLIKISEIAEILSTILHWLFFPEKSSVVSRIRIHQSF